MDDTIEQQLQERMERLELRFMDLEHTLEVLNHTTLELHQHHAQQAATLRQLENLLRRLAASLPGGSEPDPPPPHY